MTYPIPDPFDRTRSVVIRRRSNKGATDARVIRHGRPSVMGALDIDATGRPLTTWRDRAAAAAAADLLTLIDGSTDADRIADIASHYYDIDPVIGTDRRAWHLMEDDTEDGSYRDALETWANPSDPWTAAHAAGYITDSEFPAVRDGSRPLVAGRPRRRVPMPARYRLRAVRPRKSDPAAADHEIVSPYIDPSMIWVGHRLMRRGLTVRDAREAMARRSVARAGARSDHRDAITVDKTGAIELVAALAVGDMVVMSIQGRRARVSRIEDHRYTATMWVDGKARRIGNNPRFPVSTAAGIIDKVTRA